MKAIYVTVSIPLLFVLVGFNHAHGLTTFGKPNSQNQQPPNLYSKAKPCKDQTNCISIKTTTCLKGYCLCGDNTAPINGACKNLEQGPNHICTKNGDCVENADCIPIKDVKLSKEMAYFNQTYDLSICRCVEGYAEIGHTCGGEMNLSTISLMIASVMIIQMFI